MTTTLRCIMAVAAASLLLAAALHAGLVIAGPWRIPPEVAGSRPRRATTEHDGRR